MKLKRLLFTAVLALGVVASTVTTALADSIGYVDMQRVFVAFTETKKAEDNFKKKQDKLKKEFEKRQEKVEKAKEKGKPEKEIRELIEELEEELKPQQEELMQLHSQLMSELKQKILFAVRASAKEYGIDVVVDKQAVYNGGFDLTDFVIERLNR
ncbi:MAG: OmpH family outer membrane protein [bacterium]|nr:OmpH family outer membrane protein [bacterium]